MSKQLFFVAFLYFTLHRICIAPSPNRFFTNCCKGNSPIVPRIL